VTCGAAAGRLRTTALRMICHLVAQRFCGQLRLLLRGVYASSSGSSYACSRELTAVNCERIPIMGSAASGENVGSLKKEGF
jgi:hypothetical protein